MKSRQIRSSISLILITVFFIACSSPKVESSVPAITTEVQIPKPAPTATVKSSPPTEPADIIFHHGTIVTIEKAKPLAEAVAVRENLIQAVGSNTEE